MQRYAPDRRDWWHPPHLYGNEQGGPDFYAFDALDYPNRQDVTFDLGHPHACDSEWRTRLVRLRPHVHPGPTGPAAVKRGPGFRDPVHGVAPQRGGLLAGLQRAVHDWRRGLE